MSEKISAVVLNRYESYWYQIPLCFYADPAKAQEVAADLNAHRRMVFEANLINDRLDIQRTGRSEYVDVPVMDIEDHYQLMLQCTDEADEKIDAQKRAERKAQQHNFGIEDEAERLMYIEESLKDVDAAFDYWAQDDYYSVAEYDYVG